MRVRVGVRRGEGESVRVEDGVKGKTGIRYSKKVKERRQSKDQDGGSSRCASKVMTTSPEGRIKS